MHMLVLTLSLLSCQDENRPKRLNLGFKQPGTNIKVEEDVYKCGEDFMKYISMVKAYIKAVDNAQKGSTTAVKRADKLISRIQAAEAPITIKSKAGELSERCQIEFTDKRELFISAVNEFGEKPHLSKKEIDDLKRKMSCPVLCESRPKEEQDGCLNACMDKENRNYSGD